MVGCELEDEDDWVVVNKQTITSLVPPRSPLLPQSISPVKTKPRMARRSSGTWSKRQPGPTEDECPEAPATLAPADVSLSLADGVGIDSRAEEPAFNPVASPENLGQPYWKGMSMHRKSRKSINVPRSPPIGTLNVVNRRVRAQNLGRKLEGLGGLSRWLCSQGLDRFIKVFEREKIGKNQLANLTMRALKDMGTEAVGPRRKLIHAIDRLCQPYYFNTALQ